MIGGRSALTSWAAHDVRARWPMLVGLGVLAGVTAGVALAALGGAARTDTALDRLREREVGADAVVFATQVNQFQTDWDQLAAAPEVETVAPWSLIFGSFEPPLDEGGPGIIFGSVDGRYLEDTNRPVVVDGRMYDPDAADEIVIDENVPADLVDVGDVVPFHAYGADQQPGDGAATGPQVDLRVVGRVKTLAQFLFVTDGQLMVSPGFTARYGDQVIAGENADVRLVDGADGADELERTVTRVVASGTPILDLNVAARRVETTMSVERTALLAFAAAVALVGLVLVAQALGRSASIIADDAPTLRAIGMTRGQLTVASSLAHLPAYAAAVVATIATSAVASVWFPVGIAGRVDPDRGIQASWGLLTVGSMVAAVLLVGGVAVLTALAVRPARATPARSGGLLARARNVVPLAVGLGTTMALRPGTGRARIPVRPALVGAVVGVMGVTGALTISHGLDDALDHPERAGVAWDAEVAPLPGQLTQNGVKAGYTSDIGAVDGVADLAMIDRALVDANGIGEQVYAVRPAPGDPQPVVSLTLTSGRAPTESDEVAIGPATASSLGLGIGDTVAMGSEDRPFRVVGMALFPSDVHGSFDEGMWATAEGLDPLVPDAGPESPLSRFVVVQFAPAADADTTVAAIGEAVGDRSEDGSLASTPPELENLRNISSLPTLLAAFLAVVAVAALAHVLATSARRRSHEFAVLRALGVTRRSVRSVLNAQGSTVALVGLLVGVPLGVAVGRVAWRLVAERVPLAVVEPFALAALLLVVPVTLLVANVSAIWPGRRVVRQHPGAVLRTE